MYYVGKRIYALTLSVRKQTLLYIEFTLQCNGRCSWTCGAASAPVETMTCYKSMTDKLYLSARYSENAKLNRSTCRSSTSTAKLSIILSWTTSITNRNSNRETSNKSGTRQQSYAAFSKSSELGQLGFRLSAPFILLRGLPAFAPVFYKVYSISYGGLVALV